MMIPDRSPTGAAACRCLCEAEPHGAGRRHALVGALAGTLAAFLPTAARGQSPSGSSASRRPQPGDGLTFQAEDRQGQPLKPADLVIGAPPIMAYPVDPASSKVLVSRVNLLTVVRIQPDALKPSSAKNAVDGVVAFSALCTHAGCPVTSLHPGQTQLVCNCHGSVFDACDRGKVTAGPATRRLAMVPLALKDGVLTVAGGFDGAIGAPI